MKLKANNTNHPLLLKNTPVFVKHVAFIIILIAVYLPSSQNTKTRVTNAPRSNQSKSDRSGFTFTNEIVEF